MYETRSQGCGSLWELLPRVAGAFVVVLFALCSAGTGAEREVCPVNINKASVKQLEAVPGLGHTHAEMIVHIRERNGPFRQVEELKALPRLSEKAFRRLRKHLAVSDCKPKPDHDKTGRQ